MLYSDHSATQPLWTTHWPCNGRMSVIVNATSGDRPNKQPTGWFAVRNYYKTSTNLKRRSALPRRRSYLTHCWVRVSLRIDQRVQPVPFYSIGGTFSPPTGQRRPPPPPARTSPATEANEVLQKRGERNSYGVEAVQGRLTNRENIKSTMSCSLRLNL